MPSSGSRVVIDVLAHRGASKERPENTIAAFALAEELGATAIETDAHVTADGEVVLAHDATGARTRGDPRAIAELPLAEVRAWGAPTLEEALAAIDLPFNVDVKPRSVVAAEAVVRVVRRANAAHRVLLTSFHALTLRAVRAAGYAGRTGLAELEVARLLATPTRILRMFPLGGVAAQVPRTAMGVRLDTPRFVRKCHTLGIVVHYWVVDDQAEARALRDLGADGVVTNDVRAITAALRA
jgi:glycerophosphoryl diester phosphodiesterase